MQSEKNKVLKKLQSIMSENPLIICIGNELRGDDGAGIVIGRSLEKIGSVNTLLVYDTPENYLQKIVTYPADCRLWVDVVNWGAAPGSFTLFRPDEIQHFAISTHNYSPIVLLQYLKNFRDIPDYFLGIQPADMSLGKQLSPPVSETIERITEFFIETARKND
jgi:hydrogenase 3 maturation protease